MKTIRWGIIGCGDVTEVKSGPGFQLARNSELIAVMRRSERLAEDYARRHGVPRWYSDADKLIGDPEVDAVYIATPPAFHMEYALRSIAMGKPTYVEKPMALNYEECLRMVEASQQSGVPLFVAYYRRALDRYNKVKELVDEGAIGEVRFLTMNLYREPTQEEITGTNLPWRVIPEIAGGGRFLDLASHTLDIFDYILGPIDRAKGFSSNQANLYKAEDMVTAALSFHSGVQGTGSWCFSAYTKYDMNEIIGSRGKITFSTFGSEPIQLITRENTEQFDIVNPRHIQQQLIQTIVDELNSCGSCPSTGQTGARTNRVMDDILKERYA